MKVRHEFIAWGLCPEDEAPDRYEIIVETTKLLLVESIKKQTMQLLSVPIYQEDFTEKLASQIGASITTICTHSEVKTTCIS
jgi:hypothetical protein